MALIAYDQLRQIDQENLRTYLREQSAIDPRDYARDEQLAYWINLYNALTVEVVLDYPRKGSILRMGMRFFAIGPWDDEVITIAGQPITLNDIEHRFTPHLARSPSPLCPELCVSGLPESTKE